MKSKNIGIIYIMITAIDGVVKIGKTSTGNYRERMRNLTKNGYGNFNGLKEFFSIKLIDYEEKEKLLHEIFSKHRISDSEFFALDKELVKQLLLSFDGEVVFPKEVDKEKEFKKTTQKRIRKESYTFEKYGPKVGSELYFKNKPKEKALVLENNKILWNGEEISLSESAQKILNRKHQPNGTEFWMYEGETLNKRRERIDKQNLNNDKYD